MIKKLKLAFLFLIAGAVVSGFYGSGPPAQLRTLTQPKAALPHPDPLPWGEGENTEEKNFTDAEFAAHVEQLKKKPPSTDFTIIVQKPFVVIGDEPADDVKDRFQWSRHCGGKPAFLTLRHSEQWAVSSGK